MIKLDKFHELLAGVLSVPVYMDELPRGSKAPGVSWEHNGMVKSESRTMTGDVPPRTNSWRLNIVTNTAQEQMDILGELAALDNHRNDDFQDIMVVFFDGGRKSAPNELRYGVMDIETVDAPFIPANQNQGVYMMAEGGNLTFATPVAIYPEDQVSFEYIAEPTALNPRILQSIEAGTELRLVDGELVSSDKYTFKTLIGNGLVLDGHHGKISGVYVGSVKAHIWAPLTDLPIYNFSIRRGGIAKELGLSDLFFPLDDRHYDVIGGTVNVNLED